AARGGFAAGSGSGRRPGADLRGGGRGFARKSRAFGYRIAALGKGAWPEPPPPRYRVNGGLVCTTWLPPDRLACPSGRWAELSPVRAPTGRQSNPTHRVASRPIR